MKEEGGNACWYKGGTLRKQEPKHFVRTQICLYRLKYVLSPGMVMGHSDIFKKGDHTVLSLMLGDDSAAVPTERRGGLVMGGRH